MRWPWERRWHGKQQESWREENMCAVALGAAVAQEVAAQAQAAAARAA